MGVSISSLSVSEDKMPLVNSSSQYKRKGSRIQLIRNEGSTAIYFLHIFVLVNIRIWLR